MIKFKYCPYCRGELEAKNSTSVCQSCGRKIHLSSSPAASILPVKEGKVLLARRGKEPKKGSVDVVGGFLEPGEHPEEGVIREAKEETGLDIKIVKLLGVYMGNYEYQGEEVKTLNFYYIGRVVGGKMKAQDDVASLEWVAIEKLPENPAFEHQKQAFADLRRWDKESESKGKR